MTRTGTTLIEWSEFLASPLYEKCNGRSTPACDAEDHGPIEPGTASAFETRHGLPTASQGDARSVPWVIPDVAFGCDGCNLRCRGATALQGVGARAFLQQRARGGFLERPVYQAQEKQCGDTKTETAAELRPRRRAAVQGHGADPFLRPGTGREFRKGQVHQACCGSAAAELRPRRSTAVQSHGADPFLRPGTGRGFRKGQVRQACCGSAAAELRPRRTTALPGDGADSFLRQGIG